MCPLLPSSYGRGFRSGQPQSQGELVRCTGPHFRQRLQYIALHEQRAAETLAVPARAASRPR
jgi:hypothetical protein